MFRSLCTLCTAQPLQTIVHCEQALMAMFATLMLILALEAQVNPVQAQCVQTNATAYYCILFFTLYNMSIYVTS